MAEKHEGFEAQSNITLKGGVLLATLTQAEIDQVLRRIDLKIDNGSNPATLKCQVYPRFNGDTIGETDNIAKGATTGNFTLSAAGEDLRIEASGLTGNVVMAHGVVRYNASATALILDVLAESNDIRMVFRDISGGNDQDLTTLVDTGVIHVNILYMTSA